MDEDEVDGRIAEARTTRADEALEPVHAEAAEATPRIVAIGSSTAWNGMKQANSIMPNTSVWPRKRHLVST